MYSDKHNLIFISSALLIKTYINLSVILSLGPSLQLLNSATTLDLLYSSENQSRQSLINSQH